MKKILSKTILQVISIIIMILSILFCYTWGNGYNYGDEVLRSFGLKAWSNFDSGTHYTVLYSFIMILIAFLIFAITTEKKFITFIYFLFGFAVIFIILNITL